MKKKIIFVLFSILIIIGLSLIIYPNKKEYIEIDGIKYAILVDGVKATSFPVGIYKVDVNCNNAYGYWDSFYNKIIIKDVSGEVTCNVSFDSTTSSDILNDYLINLSGSTQGDGALVHEILHIPNFSGSSPLTQFGSTPAYFQNSSQNANNQTVVDDYWTLNSSTGEFSSNPSKMTTSNRYYHLYVKVPEAGYYQVCYTIERSTNINDGLNLVKNLTSITSIGSSTSADIGPACLTIGYFEENDYINISERAYTGISAPQIVLSIKKTNNTVDIDAGYRYEGVNPNNYILFNNELWRIIGVMNENSHGIYNKNLVKIIRASGIDSLAWNKTSNNNWPDSSLYHLLNYEYYDWETNKANIATYCYIGSYAKNACDYTIKGIKEGYRGMIANATWYLGGGAKDGYTNYVVNDIYDYERNPNAVYTGRSASTTGKIGLMYESDYLLGALESDCHHFIQHSNYATSNCAGKNWLIYGEEWLLTPRSNSTNYIYYVYSNGNVSNTSTTSALQVRPVLYLIDGLYRISGTGSITDPYIIDAGLQ